MEESLKFSQAVQSLVKKTTGNPLNYATITMQSKDNLYPVITKWIKQGDVEMQQPTQEEIEAEIMLLASEPVKKSNEDRLSQIESDILLIKSLLKI